MSKSAVVQPAMSAAQESAGREPPAAWRLADGEVLRLRVGRGARWLQVRQGRVWLTRSGSLDDVWLSPGDSVRLARGADAVIEAAGDACFELLEPPQPQAGMLGAAGGLWRAATAAGALVGRLSRPERGDAGAACC